MAFVVEDLQVVYPEDGLGRFIGRGWALSHACPRDSFPGPRIGFDLLRRAFLEQAAIVHHRDILRHTQRDIEIVFDDDVADMLGQRVEDGDEVAALGRRKSCRRLVEQDEARCACLETRRTL
ncbi:hypothetical protein [Mesorhizobium amorphae]|uniref:hypothetical protein n=1 Tax=Mesorhizobium amorphae TaxID=71433 RepID=UPI00177C8204|nr:hypothetical protein [Mesorhizobium amorphae]